MNRSFVVTQRSYPASALRNELPRQWQPRGHMSVVSGEDGYCAAAAKPSMYVARLQMGDRMTSVIDIDVTCSTATDRAC